MRKPSTRELLRGVVLPTCFTRTGFVNYLLPEGATLVGMGWRSGNSGTTLVPSKTQVDEAKALVVQDLGMAGVLSHGWRTIHGLYKLHGKSMLFGYVRLGGQDIHGHFKSLPIMWDHSTYYLSAFWLGDPDVT